MDTSNAPNLEPAGLTEIPVRSVGQAMDWSLVLLSQGVECAIQQNEKGWMLVVPVESAAPARAAIRLYEAENQKQPWRQEVFHSGLLFDWASVGWALGVAAFFWLNTTGHRLQDAGIMDAQAAMHGEWWRLFTAIWLHGDLGHLAMNLAIGLPLLGLAMGSCGSGVGFLAALLAGATGNLATLFFSLTPHRSLGASGMVMGALGLLAAQWLALRHRTARARRLALGGIGGGVMLFALLGLSPGTDVVAHAGGFVGGLLMGAAIAQHIRLARRAEINVAAGILSTAFVLWTWWLALR